MTAELVAFLAARLDEDEAGANWLMERVAQTLEPVPTWLNVPLYDRMLREVAAKRAILDEFQRLPRAQLFDALRHLTAVYAGHPGYRAEWKP